MNLKLTVATLGPALGLLAACSIPIKPVTVTDIAQIGHSDQKTMGEIIYIRYYCPCMPMYRLDHDVRINGRPTLAGGSVWVARWENSATGEKLLTDPVIVDATSLGDADFAVVLESNGLMSSEATISQFRGMKAGRTWGLKDPQDAGAMIRDGFYSSGRSWTLIYVGPDRADKRTLRFSIVDRGGGTERESKGQVEYVHSLDDGNEFAIRGVRIRIDGVAPDGSMNFTILKEGASDY